MKKKTNKEVVKKLTEYFIEQDPKIVAKTLAGILVDLNRLYNIEVIPSEEMKSLVNRIEHNVLQIQSFIKNGSNGPLTLGVLNE